VQARSGPRGWLEVTVIDHGAGLPSASLETLFEKTGPAGRNRSQGGLGLGLYLCRLVVERSFGGRIWVASSDRNGTTFKFIVRAMDASGKSRAQESAGTARWLCQREVFIAGSDLGESRRRHGVTPWPRAAWPG